MKFQDDSFSGSANDGSDRTIAFTAKRSKIRKKAKPKKENPSELVSFYPEGSYGLKNIRSRSNDAILINDATLWTCGPKGILEDWDILLVDGKIEKVALIYPSQEGVQ